MHALPKSKGPLLVLKCYVAFVLLLRRNNRFTYNANSKDTGGLVGDDWQTLVWRKLTW